MVLYIEMQLNFLFLFFSQFCLNGKHNNVEILDQIRSMAKIRRFLYSAVVVVCFV